MIYRIIDVKAKNLKTTLLLKYISLMYLTPYTEERWKKYF